MPCTETVALKSLQNSLETTCVGFPFLVKTPLKKRFQYNSFFVNTSRGCFCLQALFEEETAVTDYRGSLLVNSTFP